MNSVIVKPGSRKWNIHDFDDSLLTKYGKWENNMEKYNEKNFFKISFQILIINK